VTQARFLYPEIALALGENDVASKCDGVRRLAHDWQDQRLIREKDSSIEDFDQPGRPERPRLVDPREVPRRGLTSERGRLVMLHAFAHIEFNAINLALDAAYRFRSMPDPFIEDWLGVAVQEAEHFQLINDYLHDLGSYYGEFPAHNGLWDMVCKTRHDVLHRMALVPRVMEARGLDVTPGLMRRFAEVGDERAVSILQVIYREEIGHVCIGNHWYHFCCQQRKLDARETFRQLIDQYFSGRLRGPFNHAARIDAGFDEDEISMLENSLCTGC
jgi:uncharacterized ferritin-like protein (DUF455 family)